MDSSDSRSPSPAGAVPAADSDGSVVPARLGRLARRLRCNEGYLWAVAFGLLAFDLATTVYGLGIGLTEANPVAASLIDRYGLLALGGLKAAALAVAAVGWYLVARRHRAIVPICLAVPWSVGSVSNAVVIARVVGS